uniref:glycosyltransferase family 2 protein n=1 Tax=Algoriphagus sp. TaxID=1872435 RepID=UPI004048422E
MKSKNSEVVLSVVMPVYNAGEYLQDAIDSILNQSYKDFEFIIINDGSVDNSESIILNYTDKRIRYISNETNRGIVYSLNRAVESSKGLFIARMDQDDISNSKRFELQLKAFSDNSNLILCSTWYTSIYKNRFLSNNTLPVNDGQIKAQLLFGNAICHPSVMFRKKVWTDHLGYWEEDINCEDFGLWSRAALSGEFYNLPIFLLKYRIHNMNMSKNKGMLRVQSEIKIIENSFKLQLNLEDFSSIWKTSKPKQIIEFVNFAFEKVEHSEEDYKEWVNRGLFRLLVSKVGLKTAVRNFIGIDPFFLKKELLHFVNEKFKNRLFHTRKFLIDLF